MTRRDLREHKVWRPHRGKRARERGVALVMVLGAIAIMIVMLAEFQDDTGAELASATAARDSVQAEYYARSAINLSRLLVAAEPTMRQAITPLFMLMRRTPPQLPVWEYADRILGAFNDKEATQDFIALTGLDASKAKNIGLKGGGHFEISIVDEDSKINLNMGAANEIAHIRLAKLLMQQTLVHPECKPLFEQRDPQGNYHDPQTVCSALIDWADPDEQSYSCDLTAAAPASNGVEDGWYQLLPKPYRRKNAPYDSLEELHMVRGVGEDLWACMVDPAPNDPKKRQWTVWGQGAININGATASELLAIACSGAPTAPFCTDPAQMQLFITAVTMAQAITMGAPLFGSPRDFIATLQGRGMLGPMLHTFGLNTDAVKFQSESEFSKSISTESKVLSMYAIGSVKGYKRETRLKIHAVVDFRSAPSLTGGPAPGTPGGTPAPTPGASAGSPNAQQITVGQDPNAIAAAMQPSTGGTIIYWSME